MYLSDLEILVWRYVGQRRMVRVRREKAARNWEEGLRLYGAADFVQEVE